MGVSPHRGLGQEGRLWLSKRPQLYLYYIFSSPGLFQREESAVFRFPIRLASVFYFPTLSPTMYLFPERRSPGVLHVWTVFASERYSQSVIVKCAGSDGRLRDCFASPVFQWGPKTVRNS